MTAVVMSSWPVSDVEWGPVPPRARLALERLFKKSVFCKLLERGAEALEVPPLSPENPE